MAVSHLLHSRERDIRCFGDQRPLAARERQQAGNDRVVQSHHYKNSLSAIGEQCQPLSESWQQIPLSIFGTVGLMRRQPTDNRPTGSKPWKLPKGIDPESLPAVFARNVWALMSASTDLQSQSALAKKAGIGQATIDRILECTPGTRLDNIGKIAWAFGVNPWIMLHPNMAHAESEAAFYARMRAEFAKRDPG
jgi:hypothetical protein